MGCEGEAKKSEERERGMNGEEEGRKERLKRRGEGRIEVGDEREREEKEQTIMSRRRGWRGRGKWMKRWREKQWREF